VCAALPISHAAVEAQHSWQRQQRGVTPGAGAEASGYETPLSSGATPEPEYNMRGEGTANDWWVNSCLSRHWPGAVALFTETATPVEQELYNISSALPSAELYRLRRLMYHQGQCTFTCDGVDWRM
jgi:hypothetical protein